MCAVTQFLGIEFMWKPHADGHLYVHLDQTAFADNLVEMKDICHDKDSVKSTIYHNRHSIDSVNYVHLPSA